MAYSLFELVSPEIRNTFIAINFVPVFLALVGYLAGWANGRMRRSDYWTYGIFITIAGTILFSLTVFAGIESLGNDVVISLRYFAVSYLIQLVVGIIMFFLQVRRFHDAGYSGAVALGLGVAEIPLACMGFLAGHGSWIPILLFSAPVTIPYLIILCRDSEKGKNKWGMSKKYPTPVSFDSPNLLPVSALGRTSSQDSPCKKPIMTRRASTAISPDRPSTLPTPDIGNVHSHSTNTASEQSAHPETTVKAAPAAPHEGKSQAAVLLGRLIHRLFPTLKTISLGGRLCKRDYLKHALCCGMHLLGVGFAFFAGSSLDLKGYGTIAACLYLMAMFWGLFILLVLLALGVMRYHDTGKSGRGCVILSTVCIASFLLARYLWGQSTSSGNVWFAVIALLAGILAALMLVVRLLADSCKEESPWGESPDDDSAPSSASLPSYKTQLVVASIPLSLCLILMLAAAFFIPYSPEQKIVMGQTLLCKLEEREENEGNANAQGEENDSPLHDCDLNPFSGWQLQDLVLAGADLSIRSSSGSTALSYAASAGDTDICRALIECGSPVNERSNNGKTALIYAAEKGYAEICRLLLDHQADINATDNHGKSALAHAAIAGHADICRLLAERKARIDTFDKDGKTAWLYAIEAGRSGISELLCKAGGNIDARDEGGKTALMRSIEKSGVGLCRALLEQGAEPDVKDGDGMTVLMQASLRGNPEICKLLLEHGADMTITDNVGRTPLWHAAAEGNVNVCRLLLEHGADVSARDNSGATPLGAAAYSGRANVCQLLLEHGADSNAKDGNGVAPLGVAAMGGHFRVCELLLSHGADVNGKYYQDFTPLMLTASAGDNVRVCTLLLEHGADINSQSTGGMTTLGLAIKNNYAGICKLLLEHGVDANSKLADGASALWGALKNHNADICRLLLEHGANAREKNQSGKTPLMYAAENGSAEMIDVLAKAGVNVNETGDDGYTALMVAAKNNQMSACEKLIEHHAIVGKKSRNGLTATDVTSSMNIRQLLQSRTISLDEAVELLCKYDIVDRFERTTVKEDFLGRYYTAETGSGEFLRHYMYYKDGEEDITAFPYLPQIVRFAGGGKLPVKCVEAFIEAGCDVNGKNGAGCSALIYAAQNGQTEICQLLLEYGADVNAKDNDGETALMHAAKKPDYKTCEFLLQHGADINAKGNNGRTTLMKASVTLFRDEAYKTCEFLLQHSADVNAKDKDGETALMLAAGHGRTEICQMLLEHGADINAKGKDGQTALMSAARGSLFGGGGNRDHYKTCELLLQHGADVNAKDKKGMNALMHAAREGYGGICELLIQHGCAVNAKDKEGKTALWHARYASTRYLLEDHGGKK